VALLEQLIQLLSESPGNIIYHLVLLFAAQALLGMAVWTARQFPQDGQARRLAVAGGGLLISRLILVVAYAVSRPDTAGGLLPPLEQAINTVTVLLLVWSLVPTFRRVPRLVDAFFLILLLLTGIVYGLFAFSWAAQLRAGLLENYNSSSQTVIWSIAQLTILLLGLLLSVRVSVADRWLRGLILALLSLAHFAHLWNYPELLPSGTEIPYWIRLGQLVTIPLFVAFTYRHLLRQLVSAQLANRPLEEQAATSLALATPVVSTLAWHDVLAESARLLARLLDVDFSAVAVHLPEGVEHLHLVSEHPVAGQDWLLRLDNWPAFRLAMDQRSAVELQADGMGARQLHDLGQELGAADARRLLVEPLQAGETIHGLLLLASRQEGPWPTQTRALSQALASYLAVALHHARGRQPLATDRAAPSEDLISLQRERDEALAALQLTQERVKTLESADAGTPAVAETQTALLEAEVARLKAELAAAHLARESDGEGAGPVVDQAWVTAAVDRYEGELSEAQARIRALEGQLAAHAVEPSPSQEKVQPAVGEAVPNGQVDRANAQETIEDALIDLSDQVREKGLRLYLDIQPQLPPLPMDRETFYQIVTHLLENACEASPDEGHIAVRAHAAMAEEAISTESDVTGFIQLSVQDTGFGIRPSDQARVFEPHFKAGGTSIPGIGDTGIGLSIVRSLVEAHGGRVWVEASTGQGSTFKVLLPLSANGTPHDSE
jgi:signal transduction histidine kinase